MTAKEKLTPLQEWLVEETERRGLTWREASIAAGVNAGAISGIMSGVRPGLRVCVALAEYFDVPAEYILRMAGHMEPRVVADGELHLSARKKFDQLRELGAGLPEDVQVRWVEALAALTELLREYSDRDMMATPDLTEAKEDDTD